MQSYFLQRFPSLCFPRGKESIWQSERRGSVNNVGVAFAIIRFHDIEGLLLHRIGYRRKVYFLCTKVQKMEMISRKRENKKGRWFLDNLPLAPPMFGINCFHSVCIHLGAPPLGEIKSLRGCGAGQKCKPQQFSLVNDALFV